MLAHLVLLSHCRVHGLNRTPEDQPPPLQLLVLPMYLQSGFAGVPHPAAVTTNCYSPFLHNATGPSPEHHPSPFEQLCCLPLFSFCLAQAISASKPLRRARANFTRCLQAYSCCLVAGGGPVHAHKTFTAGVAVDSLTASKMAGSRPGTANVGALAGREKADDTCTYQ